MVRDKVAEVESPRLWSLAVAGQRPKVLSGMALTAFKTRRTSTKIVVSCYGAHSPSALVPTAPFQCPPTASSFK